MVIYLMNLFIGLLNIAIEDYHNKHEIFLHQKAKVSSLITIYNFKCLIKIHNKNLTYLLFLKIIMEIELFYMTHSQRCNEIWFPDQT